MNDQFIKVNPQNNYNKYWFKTPYKIDLISIIIINTINNRHQNTKNTAKKEATYN